MDLAAMSDDDKLGVLEMSVRNVCVGGDFDRMQSALAFFQKINGDGSGRGTTSIHFAPRLSLKRRLKLVGFFFASSPLNNQSKARVFPSVEP